MAIAIIDSWLNNPKRTYETGKALYERYGENMLLKALLSKGHDHSSYHFQRLLQELRALNEQLVEMPATKTKAPAFVIPALESIPLPKKLEGYSESEYAALPDQIKDLLSECYRLNAHSKLLFSQCRICTNEPDRLQLDLAILRERRRINQIWKLVDDYHKNRVLKKEIEEKGKTDIDNQDLANLITLSKNLPSYISKAKAALASMADGPKKEKKHKKLLEFEVQLEQVKKRLEAKQ